MWEFLEIVWNQLNETFTWCITGFLITIVALIILYKNELLCNSGPLGFIKRVSYYLFFPLYIGIITWFFAATYIVEKDAMKLAEITIEQAEKSLYPEFYSYAAGLADQYIGDDLKSKEEIVSDFLTKQGFNKGDLTTTTMQWTLENAISLLENKAIENGNIEVGEENLNIPELIANYLHQNNNVVNAPFSYLKGMSYQMIRSYTSSFYLLYFFMALVVILILVLDIYLKYRSKKREKLNFVHPNQRNQTNIGEKQDTIEEQKKLK